MLFFFAIVRRACRIGKQRWRWDFTHRRSRRCCGIVVSVGFRPMIFVPNAIDLTSKNLDKLSPDVVQIRPTPVMMDWYGGKELPEDDRWR